MAVSGLRERRRRQTSAEIQRVTMRMVRERGFDNVTVDEISAAAGISTRTFFNYFPNKESAIVWAPTVITDEQAAEFVAAGPAPYRRILDDVIALTVDELADDPPTRRLVADLLEIAQTSVAVTSAMLAQYDRHQRRLATLVADRIGAQPHDEVPTLIATLALAVTRAGIDRWANTDPADAANDSPAQDVRRAAELVQSFFTQDSASHD